MSDVARSNWGRWGDEDERGTLNYIGPAQVLRGILCVRTGRVYHLGHVIGSSRSPVIEGRRGSILHHLMRDGGDPSFATSEEDFVFAEDYIGLPVHSCTTHIDAIGHGGSEGKIYNGFPMSSITSRGVWHCSVESMGPIVTRCIFFDIPSLEGVDHIADDFIVESRHLERWLSVVGQVESGDAVFLRTGYPTVPKQPNDLPMAHPGLGASSVDWFDQKQISVIGADTLAVECVPSQSGAFSPLHVRLIRDLGLPLLELAMLDELAHDKVTEFCLIVSLTQDPGRDGLARGPIAVV